jgi:hypothetical protein
MMQISPKGADADVGSRQWGHLLWYLLWHLSARADLRLRWAGRLPQGRLCPACCHLQEARAPSVSVRQSVCTLFGWSAHHVPVVPGLGGGGHGLGGVRLPGSTPPIRLGLSRAVVRPLHGSP